MPAIVDAHQHFWNLERVAYPWLTPEYGPLYRTFEAPELEPQVLSAGVDATVLVQAADSEEDTAYMLEVAGERPWVGGVVAWVPLERPADAERSLERLVGHPRFCGVRHLIHEDPDPDWLLRDAVLDGLRLLAERDIPFDVVAVLPRHLEHVPVLAERVPGLRMVIDHLAKPPIREGGWQPWADLLARAAEHPQVYAKVSGLNTAADPERWSADDLRPYVEHALACFGAERLMFGGDWPVATLAGDYQKVWEETGRLLSGLPAADRDAILGGTAISFYGIGDGR